MVINFKINDIQISKEVDGTKRLIDFLREDLNITSVKEGCSEGECGACTIIFNNQAITSCTMFAGQIDGGEIITTEGLVKNGELEKLQNAFIKNGAVQCGYCTPGMILSCKALLLENPNPTDEQIKRAIEGNLCRCTGFSKIVLAVKEVIG